MKHSYLNAAIGFIGGVFFVVSAAHGDITTGLIGQWELNDGPGSSNAADMSGNDFTGTLTGFSDTSYMNMWTPDGRFGEGLLFNANSDTNDYVSIPNEGSFNFNTGREMTIAAWVNCSVPGSGETNGAAIVCKGANGQEQYSLYISNGVFASILRNSAGTGMQIINTSVSPAANTWYHVVMVWGDTPQINNIYINGQFSATKTGSGFTTSELSTSDPLTIGAKEAGTVNVNIPFQGIINDVRLYSRVLATNDIYQLYTNGARAANAPSISVQPRGVSGYLGDTPVFSVSVNSSTTLLPVSYQWQLNSSNIAGATAFSLMVSNAQTTNAGTYTVVITNSEGVTVSSNAVLVLQSLPAANTNSGLVGYWKFDDGSGSSTAADSSGNGNTGVLSGFNDPTFTTMWTNGLFGDAIDFNIGALDTNVVAVPNVGEPGPATLDFSASPIFSLSAWVMGGATQISGAGIIAKGTGGGGEQYTLDIEGGDYRFFVRDTNGNVYTAQTAVGPSGSWQHVAAVLNASNGIMNCYVNGQLEASAIAPFSLLTNSHEVSIGNRQPKAAAYGLAFTGTLDDVRIYNRDLTSADVFALYSSKPAPLTINWQETNYDVVTGSELQFAPVIAGGVPPLSYQWQQNGTNIAGATKYPLVISNVPASAGGSYDLVVSDSGIVPAATSDAVTVTMEPYLTFNTNGATWANKGSAQPSAIWLGSNVAQLTSVGSDQSNSVFYLFPQQVGQFEATFNYQMAAIPGGSTGPGDGLVFCIQNDPRGISAIGQDGTGLGVGDVTGGNLAISPSVEFEINVNSGSTSTGISWDTNGALGPSISPTPLALDGGNSSGGDLINVQIAYYDGVAAVTLTDTNAGTQFLSSTTLNIPSILGSSLGYVGFTAATGSAYGEQQVSDFTYKNVVGPVFTREPISSTNINAGGALTVSAAVIGSAPISYQWMDENNNPVIGATNATLSIADLETNNTFTLEAYSPYGTNFSSAVSVVAISGSPQLVQDITSTTAVVGSTVVFSALFQGSLPITYEWQSNGVAVANGGRVSGADTSTLTINNVQFSDAATYQLLASNSFSTAQTSAADLAVAPTLSFNDTGTGWSLQPPLSGFFFGGGDALQLTAGGLNETGSAFAAWPVYVGAFQAAFTYQLLNGTANGSTFCIQNDPRGAAAYGADAGSLGVGGSTAITPSVEVELNIYSGNGIGGVGISVNTNGAIGPTISTAPVALAGGDSINVVVTCSGGTLGVSLSDPSAGTQYSLSTNINIAAILGTNFGYVGFTASDGAAGATSQQLVTDFSYINLLSAAASVSGGNLTLSWPGASGAYSLQRTPVLGPSANWTTVPVTPASVNGQEEVTIPAPSTSEFYRLVLTNAPGNL